MHFYDYIRASWIVALLCLAVNCQDRGQHPSVYLTFEKAIVNGSSLSPVSADTHFTRYVLRLHNNTSNPIAVDANWDIHTLQPRIDNLRGQGAVPFLPDGANVELCYEAEALPQVSIVEFRKIVVPEEFESTNSCFWQSELGSRSIQWIAPHTSILFSVPKNFLGENLKVYTVFNYQWECEHGLTKNGEPRHQVYFYSRDLPPAFKADFKVKL